MLPSPPFNTRILSFTALLVVLGAGALGSAAPARGVRASAASSSGAAPSCAPSVVDRSQAVAGKALTVSPAPYSLDASHLTQISFLGAPAADLEAISVLGSRTGHHAGRLAAYSQGDGASFLPSKPFAEGELVSVRGILRMNGSETPFAWHFTVGEGGFHQQVTRDAARPAPEVRPERIRTARLQPAHASPGGRRDDEHRCAGTRRPVPRAICGLRTVRADDPQQRRPADLVRPDPAGRTGSRSARAEV